MKLQLFAWFFVCATYVYCQTSVESLVETVQTTVASIEEVQGEDITLKQESVNQPPELESTARPEPVLAPAAVAPQSSFVPFHSPQGPFHAPPQHLSLQRVRQLKMPYQFVPNHQMPSHYPLRQVPNFIPIPPPNQPVFDPAIECQNFNSKREIGKRSLDLKNIESFYLSPKNHDVMFSVCGTLLPAHLILLESLSPILEGWIDKHTSDKDFDKNPILIESITDLVGTETANNYTATCPNEDLLTAFKIFLKSFYFGGAAFDEIEQLNVAFMVWNLGHTFLESEIPRQQIEDKISKLIEINNLNKVYQFSKFHKIESLMKKWSAYIFNNAPILTASEHLPITCEEIGGDTDFLDHLLESLNLNQSRTIAYIRHYLNTCPELVNVTAAGANPFPHALFFFRCTIDDLKQLVEMGFISYEHLAEELENRLRAKERHCEEQKAALRATPANLSHLHQMELMAGRHVGRRA